MKWIEPYFIRKRQFVQILAGYVAGHQSQNWKWAQNNKHSGSSFGKKFVDLALTDILAFSEFEENYPHVVSHHVGSDSCN